MVLRAFGAGPYLSPRTHTAAYSRYKMYLNNAGSEWQGIESIDRHLGRSDEMI